MSKIKGWERVDTDDELSYYHKKIGLLTIMKAHDGWRILITPPETMKDNKIYYPATRVMIANVPTKKIATEKATKFMRSHSK
jgi:hypothetical protein